jgi:hypothetical protein
VQTTAVEEWRRWVTVALLAIAGLGHIPLIRVHLSEAPYMGVLFILFTIAALSLAAALALKRSAIWYALGGALCLSGLCAYVATRLIAFPMLSDDVGAWGEPLGVLCVTTELAATVMAALEVRRLAGGWNPFASGQGPRRHEATYGSA